MSLNRLPLRLLLLAACLLAISSSSLAEEERSSHESEPVPGQLEVVQMTAVALDARLPEGVEATAFRWRIVEGEGGKLFSADQEDAVFLAPKVERGVKEFIVELNVMYADQPMSTRELRIRVLPTDPAAAEESSDDDGTPQWIDDHYRRAREAEERKQQEGSAGSTGGGGGKRGKSGPTVSVGVAGGSGGTRGGVGVRWSLNYPVTQPVDVPPPGQSRKPGEGTWEPAHPVPYDELSTTLPPDIAERYRNEDEAPPAPSETEADPE